MVFKYVFTLLVTLALKFPAALSQDDLMPSKSVECEGVTCVSKCCPEGQLINMTSCVFPNNENELLQPPFHEKDTLAPMVKPPEGFLYSIGFPQCDMFPLQPYMNEDDKFYILEDGTIFVPLYKKAYQVAQYCIDNFFISLTETEQIALLCFEDPVEAPSRACTVAKQYVYPLLVMVSCVFLVVTLFVYICIPELRGKLHGRCLLSMISSLLAAYILMAVVYLASEGMIPSACIACASMKQMSLLASFFWLNVMCFDIWRSLRSMRPATETSARSKRRFLLYSLYAWGCPILIGTISVVIETLPETYENVVRPNFLNHFNICWFSGKKAIWYHFYMVILILVLANIFFFLWVAYILLKAQTNAQLQMARSQNRDRLWLYGRLFLVMGITWITEVISWQQGTCEAWIFTDIINALQGFTIFLVFVCKKSTRQLVGDRRNEFQFSSFPSSPKNLGHSISHTFHGSYRKINRRITKMKSTYSSSSSSSGKRSSTFFTALSKSSSSRDGNSSIVSPSSESQRLPGSQSNNSSYPLSPINESVDEPTNRRRTEENQILETDPPPDLVSNLSPPPEMDEDRPSIDGEEDQGESGRSHQREVPASVDVEIVQEHDLSRLPYVDESVSEPITNGLDPSTVNGDHNIYNDSSADAVSTGSSSINPLPQEDSSPLIANGTQDTLPSKATVGQTQETSSLLPTNV